MKKQVDFEVPGWGELAAGPAGWPGYAERVLARGPVAYWRSLDPAGQQVPDVAGGHDGAVIDGVSDVTGALHREADPALRFEPGRVAVPSDLALSGFGDFTIALWLWTDALPTSGVEYLVNVYGLAGDQRSWALNLNASAGEFRMNLSDDGSGFVSLSLTPFSAIQTQRWHHLAIRRSGASVKAVLDGAREDTAGASYGQTLHASSADLTMGERADPGAGRWGGGRLDEVAVFDHALSEAAITELYEVGRGIFRTQEGQG